MFFILSQKALIFTFYRLFFTGSSNTDANMMAFTLTHETLVEVDPDTNEVIPGMAKHDYRYIAVPE